MPSESAPLDLLQKKRLISRPLEALSNHDFRWLWTNNVVMSLVMSLEMLAQGWLVLSITGSPFWVGAAAGVRGAGLVVFGALGGVVADRVSRRKALALCQTLRPFALATVGLLVVSGHIELWHVLAVALFQGLLMAVEAPVNNALVYDTAGRHLLLNAMAVRIMAFNFTQIVGSLLAGALISALGTGPCYLFAAGVSALSPIPLLFMRVKRPTVRIREPVWRNLKEGVGYAAQSGPLRVLLLFSLLLEMFGFSYGIMLPVIARDVLHVGPSGLGFLSAAGGVGGLLGSLAVASLGDFRAKTTLLGIAGGGVGVFLLLFALSPWFATSVVLAALIGAALMATGSTLATLLPLVSTDAMRGRILGLHALTFGFTPLGGFNAGVIASAVSAPFAIGLGGVVLVAYSLGVLRIAKRLQEAAR